MISPSTPIARGIQISRPKAAVIRSAMLVLPLPGGPKRNSPRPELIGRPQPVEHVLAQQQAVERAVQVFGRGMLVGQRLGVDAGDVVLQGDGRRAEVGAVLRIPPPALAAQVAELVLEVVHRGRAAVDHQLLVLHLAEQLVDQHEGQLDLVGDVAAGGVAAGQQELQDQGLHFAVGQAGGAERRRLDRRK